MYSNHITKKKHTCWILQLFFSEEYFNKACQWKKINTFILNIIYYVAYTSYYYIIYNFTLLYL